MPLTPYTLNRGLHLARQLHFRQWVRILVVNERNRGVTAVIDSPLLHHAIVFLKYLLETQTLSCCG